MRVPRESRFLNPLRHISVSLLVAVALNLAIPCHAPAVEPALQKAEQTRIETIKEITPAVVAIFAPGGQGGGSGVVITPDGFALSNYHVTSACGNFMKCGLPDGNLYDAVIVSIDPTGDVALIKLFGKDKFTHARLGDSDKVRMGDSVYALGNPFLLASDFQPTVTAGIVSGTHRYQYPAGTILEYTDCLQVDASINPGNSGGPLFNSAGELIGINGRISIEKRGRVNSGVGYAISINQIKHFMEHLLSGRIVDHATLGATVTTRDDGAVVVSNILEESEAFRRGLRVDDELVSFAGRPIRSVNQFKNVLGIYPSGWQLPLSFRREGKKQDVIVRLRRLHAKSEFMQDAVRPAAPRRPRKPGDHDQNPPDKQPGPPRRGAPGGRPAPPPPPPELAKYHVARTGFANYYFNQVAQDRLLKSLAAWGDFAPVSGTWKISATATGATLGKDARADFKLADNGVALLIDGNRLQFLQTIAAEMAVEDEPPKTGGFLAALHQLRLLLSKGKPAFADVVYQGSEPLDGTGESVDVLITEQGEASNHWYFSRAHGGLIGFDFFAKDDADACEVRFDDLREFNGKRLPGKITVRHGGQEFGVFTVRDYDLQPRPAGAKS